MRWCWCFVFHVLAGVVFYVPRDAVWNSSLGDQVSGLSAIFRPRVQRHWQPAVPCESRRGHDRPGRRRHPARLRPATERNSETNQPRPRRPGPQTKTRRRLRNLRTADNATGSDRRDCRGAVADSGAAGVGLSEAKETAGLRASPPAPAARERSRVTVSACRAVTRPNPPPPFRPRRAVGRVETVCRGRISAPPAGL